MTHEGDTVTPVEAIKAGARYAHKQLVDCPYDMRNFDRSYLGTTGKVG